mgnify:CR=1 FL=1
MSRVMYGPNILPGIMAKCCEGDFVLGEFVCVCVCERERERRDYELVICCWPAAKLGQPKLEPQWEMESNSPCGSRIRALGQDCNRT